LTLHHNKLILFRQTGSFRLLVTPQLTNRYLTESVVSTSRRIFTSRRICSLVGVAKNVTSRVTLRYL